MRLNRKKATFVVIIAPKRVAVQSENGTNLSDMAKNIARRRFVKGPAIATSAAPHLP